MGGGSQLTRPVQTQSQPENTWLCQYGHEHPFLKQMLLILQSYKEPEGVDGEAAHVTDTRYVPPSAIKLDPPKYSFLENGT